MTTKQKQLLESFISKVVKRVLNEQTERKDYGFSISTSDEHTISMNAEDDNKTLTKKDWSLINKDISKIEENIIKWLDTIGTARDEGHGSDDSLVGTFFIDSNHEFVEVIDEVIEQNEPLRTSSGTLTDHIDDSKIWQGTSKLSKYIDVEVKFFN